MPSHLFADRPAQPPEPGSVDALISQTRRLRGEVDAVRRDTVVDDDDAQGRWQRALCDLAVHHLDDLREHLGQLKEGLPPPPETVEYPQAAPEAGPEAHTRVGSAEWNLLTDEVSWSDELFQIFGRSPESGALPSTNWARPCSPRTSRCSPRGSPPVWWTASRSTASSASSGPTAVSGPCT